MRSTWPPNCKPSRNRDRGVSRVELIAVHGLPEIRPGDDLAALLVHALQADGPGLCDGDVLAVSSKVVAKAEGRFAPGATAAEREAAVASQTTAVVAQRLTPRGLARIVRSSSGPVLAAAGVDASNVPDADDGSPRALLLPADPDGSARRLRAALRDATGVRLGVLVTDTLGRPWRIGQTDAAIGAAGVRVVDDLTGRPDAHGRVMEVTVRALADELAAAADLVKNKTDGVPLAVVRGLAHLVTEDDGPGAAALLRGASEDWFRFGHAEAARAALGVLPEHPANPPQPVVPEDRQARLERALAVASAAPSGLPLPAELTVTIGAGGEVLLTCAESSPAAWAAIGALAQRIVVAAWAEGLDVTAQVDASGSAEIAVVVIISPQ